MSSSASRQSSTSSAVTCTLVGDASFVTLHGSGDLGDDIARFRRDAGQRHLLVLPRLFDWMPDDIARDLLDHGCERSDVVLVCERLPRDDEAITRTTVGELARHAGGTARSDTPFSDLSVLVVRR